MRAELLSNMRAELLSHAREVLIYLAALSWTHTFLPTLGGPTRRSIPEMMVHKFGGPYLVFVLLYTSALTVFCFWWFRVAQSKAARVERHTSTFHMILAACLDTSAKSTAWISAWAWMIVLLGALPTKNPAEAIMTSLIITVISAAAIIAGQRNQGPLSGGLRHGRMEHLKWVIFIVSWMTAVVWVGALTVCAGSIGASPLAATWMVAIATLAARWVRTPRTLDPPAPRLPPQPTRA